MKLSILVLASVFLVAPETNEDYDRSSQYGPWIDVDEDCFNTRHEVLMRDSLVMPVLQRCKVIRGVWHDPYTNRTFTIARNLDIDHIVPLKEAHQSGANLWPEDKKRAFANDLSNLIAVHAGTNRQKGYKDPSEWLPPNENFRCAYVKMWADVKIKWDLTVDAAEEEAINRECEG